MQRKNRLVRMISLMSFLMIGWATPRALVQSGAEQIVYAVQTTSGGSDLYVMNADGSGAQQLTHDGTSSSPAWSPGHRQIAYRSKPNDVADIYVMNANGSGAQQITKDNGTDNDYPTWSPDSQQIAFVSNESGKSDVWTVSANGGKARQLTSDAAAESQSPAWSPDGQQIAYTTNHEIYLMNADGSNSQALTKGDGDSDSPAWSPDGQQIAYVVTKSGSSSILTIAVTTRQSSQVYELSDGFIGTLSWSPDGKSIAFMVTHKKAHSVFSVDTSGAKTTRLTDANVQAGWPSWGALQATASISAGGVPGSSASGTNSSAGMGNAPVALGHFSSGDKIVFTSERSGQRQIYTVDANGKNLRRLTNTDLNWYPSWSADGHSIVYMCAPVNGGQAGIRICVMDENGGHQHALHHGSGPAWSWNNQHIAFVGGNTEIYTMNVDGSNELNLTPNLVAVEPSWSPDDKQIVYTLVHDGTNDIYVLNSDGSNNHQLVPSNGFNNHSPSWSPNGQHIAFVVKENAVNQIYTVSWNGSAITRLTNDGGDIPSWSPDGQYILFVRHGQIYVMNADGSNVHNLIGSGVRDSSPGWQPVALN